MSVRSVIDVDVDKDGNFAEFAKLFEKYQSQLAKQPGAWANVDKRMKTSFEHTTAALMAQSELNRRATANAEGQAKAATGADVHWKSMARSTSTVASNINKATSSLLKWTALTSVFSGLLGAGGLFGIDRMAASAGAGRRSAQGLGTTFGAESAWKTDLNRIVDGDSFLAAVNESLHDVTKRYPLMMAGLSERQLSGKDTGQVADMLLAKLKEFVDRTPGPMLAQGMQARGFDQFVSLQDAVRLKGLAKKEVAEEQRRFRQDRKLLAVQDDSLKKWQDFTAQMSRSSATLENVFIRGLVGLEPQFEHLSASFTKAVQSFLGSEKVKKWLDDLGPSIENFAAYIGSDGFQAKVRNFVDDVAAMGSAMDHWLWVTGITPKHYANSGAGRTEQSYDKTHPYASGLTGFAQRVKDNLESNVPAMSSSRIDPATARAVDSRRNLPKGTIWGIYGTESAFGKRLYSPKGAVGPFQFMPDTARRYGLTDSLNGPKSADAAGRYMADLLKMFSGDLQKALAAYNWGEGNVKKDIAQHGVDWLKYAPRETREYVIKIYNATGSNIVTSASQLPQ